MKSSKRSTVKTIVKQEKDLSSSVVVEIKHDDEDDGIKKDFPSHSVDEGNEKDVSTLVVVEINPGDEDGRIENDFPSHSIDEGNEEYEKNKRNKKTKVNIVKMFVFLVRCAEKALQNKFFWNIVFRIIEFFINR